MLFRSGHKIFFNVPILPAVVTEKDVPFLAPLNDVVEVKKHDALAIRGHDVLVAMVEHQHQLSTVPVELRFTHANELTQCIYPPHSLAAQIKGTNTIAGGPRKPELVTNKQRKLILPHYMRQHS
ncbi:MAG: hypothetical protein IKY98_04020 [Alphaproteobacteria bacterium]|nr:hypothetical protein [Alphaproteobacteria bacterium]